MLSAMRSSSSNVFVWIIILLLIVGLAGFGISQSGGAGSELAVATVGDEEVTVNDFGQAYQGEMRRMSQTFGRQITQQEAQIFGLDQSVITQMLTLAALNGEAKRQEISVGDTTVRDRLLQDRNFVGLDGTFDQNTYELLLDRSNITPRDYEDGLRSDATRQILAGAISGGVSVGDTVPNAILKFVGEERKLSYVKITTENLSAAVPSPSDSDLEVYFETNKENYRRPETRQISYVTLREADLVDSVDVSEKDIADDYEARKSEFSQPAMLSVDRIVFGSKDEATNALGNIGETDFDALAAERGLSPADIELGEITKNQLAADARDPLFAATEPGILGPFASDLGPALYRINAILPASEQSLEDVRERIAKELAAVIANEELAKAASDIDDLIAGGATLEEVGKETAMTFGTMEYDPSVREGLSADSKFRSEVQDADVAESRDLQDLNAGGLFAIRVDSIKEPHIPPLADLKSRVTTDWSNAKTLEALRFRAEDLKKRLDAGESLADLASELTLTLETPDPVQRNASLEGTPDDLISSVFAGTNGDALVLDDGSNAFLAVIGDLIPANLNSSESRALLTQVKQALQSSTSEDMLNYFATGVQDREGINVNIGMVQSVLDQIHNY